MLNPFIRAATQPHPIFSLRLSPFQQGDFPHSQGVIERTLYLPMDIGPFWLQRASYLEPRLYKRR